jgi:hypothetical protein
MNNPFDWRNYKPTISMADIERARKSAYQQTRVVNEQRKQGIEPSKPYANSMGGIPQDYTTEMPVMPIHKRSAARKKRQAK